MPPQLTMPLEPPPTSTTKRDSPQAITTVPQDDHRKRRRNRTTQSCLNCHTSKRMCDRRRPCGRCIQLGLTGLCVYEVDDPSQRSDLIDDKSRLQKRVAELEGVIRELKNKPHPKWAQNSGPGYDLNTGRHPSSKASSPSQSSPPLDSALMGLEPPFTSSFSMGPAVPASGLEAHPTSAHVLRPASLMDESVTSLLSYLLNVDRLEDQSVAKIFNGAMTNTVHDYSNHMDHLQRHHHAASNTAGQCGCLKESNIYSVVLELSLRLRKTAETLSQYPDHGNGSVCLLKQRVAELDALASSTLGDVEMPCGSLGQQMVLSDFPAHRGTLGSHDPIPNVTRIASPSLFSPSSSTMTISPHLLTHSGGFFGERPLTEDSLMTWEPMRHGDWPSVSAPRPRSDAGTEVMF